MFYKHRLAMAFAYERSDPELRLFVDESLQTLSTQLQQVEQRDLSQTTADARGWSPRGEDYYQALLTLTREHGIQVECKAVLSEPGCQGVSFGGKVEITVRGTYLERFWTLIHECAHELLHGIQERRQLSKAAKELQAEAVTFVVSDYFCLRNVSSPVYIAKQGGRAVHLPGSSYPITRCALYLIVNIEQKIREAQEKGLLCYA